MFDPNAFKKNVKDWIRGNPEGTLIEFVDFCEDQIPPAQYAANQWLLEQTVSWYKHILTSREMSSKILDEGPEEEDDDDRATA
jgi:hypothetical protein